MNRRMIKRVMAVLGLLAFVSVVPAYAADQDRDRDRDMLQDRDIYGYQLMTEQERNTFREQMRTAKTEQEREQIRAEHHKQMMHRAKEKGVKIPDEPPARPGSMGTDRGGAPMGPGGGGRR